MFAQPAKPWLINTNRFAATRYGYGTNVSPHNHSVPLAESQHHIVNTTNTRGALHDGVEDRLHVCGRAADDAEHLGCCGLVLQRFLKLLEQSNVLDSDDGLVGKSCYKLDLFVGKGENFLSLDQDHSEKGTLP